MDEWIDYRRQLIPSQVPQGSFLGSLPHSPQAHELALVQGTPWKVQRRFCSKKQRGFRFSIIVAERLIDDDGDK